MSSSTLLNNLVLCPLNELFRLSEACETVLVARVAFLFNKVNKSLAMLLTVLALVAGEKTGCGEAVLTDGALTDAAEAAALETLEETRDNEADLIGDVGFGVACFGVCCLAEWAEADNNFNSSSLESLCCVRAALLLELAALRITELLFKS